METLQTFDVETTHPLEFSREASRLFNKVWQDERQKGYTTTFIEYLMRKYALLKEGSSMTVREHSNNQQSNKVVGAMFIKELLKVYPKEKFRVSYGVMGVVIITKLSR